MGKREAERRAGRGGRRRGGEANREEVERQGGGQRRHGRSIRQNETASERRLTGHYQGLF